MIRLMLSVRGPGSLEMKLTDWRNACARTELGRRLLHDGGARKAVRRATSLTRILLRVCVRLRTSMHRVVLPVTTP